MEERDSDGEDSSPAAITSRARAGIAESVRRIDLVSEWMASGRTPRQASTKARDEFGLSRRQADRYVAVALKRLQVDSTAEPPESKRARILAMAYDTVRQADARKRIVVTGKDSYETVDDPDLRARTSSLELIAKLEGLA